MLRPLLKMGVLRTRMDIEPFAALLSQWLGAQVGTLPGALAVRIHSTGIEKKSGQRSD